MFGLAMVQLIKLKQIKRNNEIKLLQSKLLA